MNLMLENKRNEGEGKIELKCSMYMLQCPAFNAIIIYCKYIQIEAKRDKKELNFSKHVTT